MSNRAPQMPKPPPLCNICGTELAKDGTCPGIERQGFTRRMHGLEMFP